MDENMAEPLFDKNLSLTSTQFTNIEHVPTTAEYGTH